MNKLHNYEAPVTDLLTIDLEQRFLVDSLTGSGLPDLVEDDFTSIWGS